MGSLAHPQPRRVDLFMLIRGRTINDLCPSLGDVESGFSSGDVTRGLFERPEKPGVGVVDHKDSLVFTRDINLIFMTAPLDERRLLYIGTKLLSHPTPTDQFSSFPTTHSQTVLSHLPSHEAICHDRPWRPQLLLLLRPSQRLPLNLPPRRPLRHQPNAHERCQRRAGRPQLPVRSAPHLQSAGLPKNGGGDQAR